MDVQVALNKMQAAGFSFTVINDNKLSVSPGDKLTNAQADFIRQHKPGLMRLLSVKKNNSLPVTKAYHYRLSDCPNWMVVLTPGYDLNEITESLKMRFGEKRLIGVKERERNNVVGKAEVVR